MIICIILLLLILEVVLLDKELIMSNEAILSKLHLYGYIDSSIYRNHLYSTKQELHKLIIDTQSKCTACSLGNIKTTYVKEEFSNKPFLVYKLPSYLDLHTGIPLACINDVDNLDTFSFLSELPIVLPDHKVEEKSSTNALWKTNGYIGPLYTPGQVYNYILESLDLSKDYFYYTQSTKCNTWSKAPVESPELNLCGFWFDIKKELLEPPFVIVSGKSLYESKPLTSTNINGIMHHFIPDFSYFIHKYDEALLNKVIDFMKSILI